MSAGGQPTGSRCGQWMPRAKDYCGRMPGQAGECRTPAALTDRRERLTERRREKTLVTPEARSRWNRAYKLKLMGLTPERFAQMLEAQEYACAMCCTPFEKDQRICIDHDHACCPPRAVQQVLREVRARSAVPDLQHRPRVHRDVLRDGDGLPRDSATPGQSGRAS